ncbi:MAG: putative peptidoglycan glycosyltransferase FtsW [Candidatus Aminicenantes bacterium]
MEIFRRFGFDKFLALTAIALLSVGLVMVFSSSAVLAAERHQQSFYFFLNQLGGVALGFTAVIIILSSKTPFYQKPLFIYGMMSASILFLAAALMMPSVGNTNRWIMLGGFRLQPSEITKLSLILFLALIMSRKQDRMKKAQSLLFPGAVILLTVLLIIKEPDYGTALLVFTIGAAMLFIGGVRLEHFAFLGLLFAVIFSVYLFQADYRLGRVMSFLSPETDILGSGFQAYQSKLALGAGGLLGVSIGESTQKLFFLPCAHTDYIYAILGEELGLVGALAVLILFGIILWRGLVISRNAPTVFCRLAAAGISLSLFIQALLNISVVLGLGPATGLPLPLLSYGRSSLFVTLTGIGILLHISQRKPGHRKK